MWMALIGAVTSAASSSAEGEIAQLSYELQASAKKVQAKQAKNDAQLTNLKLMQNYNDIQASNVVMGAVSGRTLSSGTVQNLTRADQEKLNWDMEYNALAGEIGTIGLLAEAQGLKFAGEQAQQAGVQKGLMTLVQSGSNFSQIG